MNLLHKTVTITTSGNDYNINIHFDFPYKKELFKITKAILTLNGVSGGKAIFNFDAQNVSWSNIDTTSEENSVITINLIDEVQTVVNNNLEEFNIIVSSEDQNNLFTFNTSDVQFDVEYLPKDYYKNSFNVFSSSKFDVSINPLNQLIGLKHLDASVSSSKLPFEIKHVYNEKCDGTKINLLTNEDIKLNSANYGKNFGLNLQQFIVKEKNNDNIIYVDENLNENILETHYYYNDEQNKVYVQKEYVEVSIDGKLSYGEHEIFTETSTIDGFKLVSDLSTFANKNTYTLPEEYANLITKYNQYKQSYINILAAINNYKSQLADLALQKYLLDGNTDNNYYTYQNYVLDNNNLPALKTLYNKVNYEVTYNNQNNVNNAEIYIAIKKTLQPYFNYDSTKKFDSKNYNISVFSEKIDQYLNEFDYSELKANCNYEIHSIEYLHQNIINTINSIDNYTLQKQDIEQTLKDLKIQLQDYKKQLPIYYLVSDDRILGFAPYKDYEEDTEDIFEAYRLVLIMDNYDNKIVINYESLDNPKIDYITTAENKIIQFNYNENYLQSIINEKEQKTIFDNSKFDNDHYIKINYHDDSSCILKYNENDKISYIIDKNKLGINITYNNENNQNKIITQELSLINNITDGVVELKTYTEGSNPSDDFLIENSQVEYNLYDYKNVIVKKGDSSNTKTYTYCYNDLGELVLEYDGNYNDNLFTGIKQYSYHNGRKKLSIDMNVLSVDYLSNLEFTNCFIPYSENYLGDDIFCGDDLYLSALIKSDYYLAYSTNTSLPLTNSFTIDSNNNSDILQSINQSNKKYFVLTGWAKGNSAYVLAEPDSNDPRNSRKFEYRVVVSGLDKNNQSTTLNTFRNGFDWMNEGWQMCAVGIDISPLNSVTSIEVTFDYSYNTGNIYFTKPSLRIGNFTYYKYEDNLLKEERGSSKYEIEYGYTNKLCTTKKVTNIYPEANEQDVFITKYVYNKENKLVKTINWDGIIEENVYNDKGQIIETKTYHKNDPSTILSSKQSFDERGKENEIFDEFGEKVQTNIYDNNDNITTVEHCDNSKVSTGYDGEDKSISLTSSANGVQNKNNVEYKCDVVTKVSHNDFDITYDYNLELRNTKISVAGNTYVQYQYPNKNKKLITANGETYSTEVNDNGDLLNIKDSNDDYVVNNVYNTLNKLTSSTDYLTHQKTDFEYDNYGKVLSKTVKDTSNNNAEKLKIENEYDDNDNITSSVITNGQNVQEYGYEYSKDLNNRLKNVSLDNVVQNTNQNVFNQGISYDLLGRTKQVKTTFGVKEYTKQYSYLTKGDKTSNYIAAEWFGLQGINKAVIHYTYDLKGNITKIKHGGQFVVGYEYDEVNRLVRENNKKLGFTKTYDYDAGGNILEERKYYFTINSLDDESPIEIKKYLYKSEGWRDQLMGYSIKTIDYYNDTSTTIDYEVGEYDSLGNPHKYNGNTMTWTRGRCLSSYNGNTFTYNADSVRTSKTKVVNNTNITTNFVLNGTKILSQSDGTNTLYFQYGSNGVEGFTLNGTQYIYQKNILGDIIGIFDSNQQLVAKYAYDAWGNQKIYALIDNEMIDITGESIYNTNIANINPFRYRGYYYDIETGFYYLNSRYYDPALGRFINADDIGVIDLTKVAINGLNLYAYCLNNPVNEKDESGYFLSFLLGLLIAAAIGATVGAVSYTASFVIGGITTGNWNWNWAGFLGSVVGGFIGGMFMMIPVVGVYVSAFATGFLSNLMTDAYSSALYSVKIDWRSSLGISVLSGLLSLALSSLITKAFGISGINTGSINWSTITTNSYELLGKGIINKVSDQILYFMIGSTIYGSALDALFHNDFMSIINELRRRIFV